MGRIFAKSHRGKSEPDNDAYEDTLSNILQRSAPAQPLPPLEQEKPVNPGRYIKDDSFKHSRPLSYQEAILGTTKQRTHSRKRRSKDINLNLSLSLKRPSFTRTRLFVKDHKIGLRKLGIAFGCLVLLYGTVSVLRAVLRDDEKPQVAGIAYIAPKTVFLPKNPPEEFTIGSSKQELENGAILYTIYGPGGEEITVNQQSSAPEFDQSILEGGFKFTTPHGTAYVLEDNQRVTGYLLAEDSWVLLNCTDGLSPEDMRVLIRSLEPTKPS